MQKKAQVFAEITGIEYKPFLSKELHEYRFEELPLAISKSSVFIIKDDQGTPFAVSWWVSPKRTRSYPYARVYNTLSFSGKKVTIIPVIKDEGKRGDRDYLQWDTISLMSLLDIYVILGFYDKAEKSPRFESKITKQAFNIDYLTSQFKRLFNYKSSALHWNLEQLDDIVNIASKALDSYLRIAAELRVEMHSEPHALKRIQQLEESKDSFKQFSRNLAHTAQVRESVTIQPKELLDGEKAIITIKNYLGGLYFFTIDEFQLIGKCISLIEGKYTKSMNLPSLDDIKDGLIKMVVFTNLKNVFIGSREFEHRSILKLTSGKGFDFDELSCKHQELYNLLVRESEYNNFELQIS